MKQISEWPFEGRLKFLFRTGVRRVGLVGNRTRYQSGVYDSTCESGRFVNLSGTAIIIILIITVSNRKV